tara:strand:+ start:1179 stop:1334 length:156 start_codon:yes stop_codon:yes gene_type:complete
MNVCDLSGYAAPRLDADVPTRQSGRIAPSTQVGLGVQPNVGLLGTADLILD